DDAREGGRPSRVSLLYGGRPVMGQAYKEITELIGGTPLVRLNRFSRDGAATIYAKVESLNPGGRVKDPICPNMIDEAQRQGRLKPGSKIVEPTSGNKNG